MKKILTMVLISILAICMVGCGEKDLPLQNEVDLPNENVIEQDVIKRYFDESLLEQYAETQVIELPENETTGYEWVFFIDDSEVISVVKDEYQAPANSDEVVGVTGKRVCEFKGLKEGDTTIEFNCIRGLEENEEPADKVKFYVSVNANNEIAIMSEVH